jgi:signal transduction histidine kinase
MSAKLITYLKYEEQLLKELLNLAEQQQNALIKMKFDELNLITGLQDEVSSNLRKAEDTRLTIIANWLKINKSKAISLGISDIAKLCSKEEHIELVQLKGSMNKLMTKLQEINTTNRVLTNRAKHSINEMIQILTNGTNNVCNVRV